MGRVYANEGKDAVRNYFANASRILASSSPEV
jgi:hypothetical protein